MNGWFGIQPNYGGLETPVNRKKKISFITLSTV